jgi:hypothetical protein
MCFPYEYAFLSKGFFERRVHGVCRVESHEALSDCAVADQRSRGGDKGGFRHHSERIISPRRSEIDRSPPMTVENVTEDWWSDIDEKRAERQGFQRWTIATWNVLEDVVDITGLPKSSRHVCRKLSAVVSGLIF